MKYLLLVENATNEIVGHQTDFSVPQAPTGFTFYSVSYPEFTQVTTAGTDFEGSQERQWTYDGTTLTQKTDSRPTSRWILGPNSTENGPVDVTVDKNAVVPDVTVQVLNAQGNVATGFNGTVYPILDGKKVKLDFTSGEAALTVNVSYARSIEIQTNPVYKVENPVTITVADTEL